MQNVGNVGVFRNTLRTLLNFMGGRYIYRNCQNETTDLVGNQGSPKQVNVGVTLKITANYR